MSEANDKERQRFEAWAKAHPLVPRIDRYCDQYSGAYCNGSLELAWQAWQAAVAGSVRFAEPVPMPVRMIELEDVDEAT